MPSLIHSEIPHGTEFLQLSRDGYTCHFLGDCEYLYDVLGIASEPEDVCCIGHAPSGKNKPHCTRKLSKKNLEQISRLMTKLLETPVPSEAASTHLKKLSSLVLCGKNKWHQNQAPAIYNNWLDRIWSEYAIISGVDHGRRDYSRPRELEFSGKAWGNHVRSQRRRLTPHDDSSSLKNASGKAKFMGNSTSCANTSNFDADDGYNTDSSHGTGNSYGTNDGYETDNGYDTDNDLGHGTPDTTLSSIDFPTPPTTPVPQKEKHAPQKDGPLIFKPFGRFEKTPAAMVDDLLSKMQQVFAEKSPGYIYGFRHPETPGMIKIGKTNALTEDKVAEGQCPKEVSARLEKWNKDCGPTQPFEVVFSVYMRCAGVRKIEALIQGTLHDRRRLQSKCPNCTAKNTKRAKKAKRKNGNCKDVEHKEWFEIDADEAKEVVQAWAQFADTEPFNDEGLDPFWSSRVRKAQRHSDRYATTQDWLQRVKQLSERRQVGVDHKKEKNRKWMKEREQLEMRPVRRKSWKR